MDLKKGIYR